METVAPNSPANTADIQPGDILVAVNSTKIASTGQATKLFKQTSDKFTIRIERRSTLKFYPSQESLSRVRPIFKCVVWWLKTFKFDLISGMNFKAL